MQPELAVKVNASKPRRRFTLLRFVGICLLLGVAVNIAAEIRQRMLPHYAQPKFIERHFAAQLETLRELARAGREPNGVEKRLFDSTQIRGALIVANYGENGRTARNVKEVDWSHVGGALLPPKPNPDRPVITIWGSDMLHYEVQIRGSSQNLVGYQLFLDLNALKALN